MGKRGKLEIIIRFKRERSDKFLERMNVQDLQLKKNEFLERMNAQDLQLKEKEWGEGITETDDLDYYVVFLRFVFL